MTSYLSFRFKYMIFQIFICNNFYYHWKRGRLPVAPWRLIQLIIVVLNSSLFFGLFVKLMFAFVFLFCFFFASSHQEEDRDMVLLPDNIKVKCYI